MLQSVTFILGLILAFNLYRKKLVKQKSWDQNFAEFDIKITNTTIKILQMVDCKIVVQLQAKTLYKVAKYWSKFFIWIGKTNGWWGF